jgi:DNA polymerase/3'-5' exonuclease PolX
LTGDDVKTKYMGIFKLGKGYPLRRIDIRYIPFESYYYATLYFTGSKDLNKKMRQLANNMNYLLNEYGLYDSNNKLILRPKSEHDIFEILGLEYLSPDKR